MEKVKTQAEIEADARREEHVFVAILVTWLVLFFGSLVVICIGAINQNETLGAIGLWIFIPTTLLAVIAIFGAACSVAGSRL
jgi:hypothetical protein